MTLPETIVARLLNEAHFEVDEHPELYVQTGKKANDGRRMVRTCAGCEREAGADQQYPADVSMSHSYCHRHLVKHWMDNMQMSQEAAEAKVGNGGRDLPDWQEARGQHAGAAVPAKAAFWVTSAGG